MVLEHRDPERSHQKFRFRLVNGKYQIFTLGGLTVEVPEMSEEDGEGIVASDNNNTANEFWEIERAEGRKNKFHIRSFCDMALDIEDGIGEAGNAIVQSAFTGVSTQMWIVKELEAWDESSVVRPKVMLPSTRKFQIVMATDP